MKRKSDRIRKLLDDGLSEADIVARLGVTRQAVRSADLHRGGMGRPRKPRCSECGGIAASHSHRKAS